MDWCIFPKDDSASSAETEEGPDYISGRQDCSHSLPVQHSHIDEMAGFLPFSTSNKPNDPKNHSAGRKYEWTSVSCKYRNCSSSWITQKTNSKGPRKTQQVQTTSVNRVYSSGLQESQSGNDYPGNKKHFFQTGKWAKGLAPAEVQSFYKSFTSGRECAGLSLLLRSQWFTRFVQRRTFVLFIVC